MTVDVLYLAAGRGSRSKLDYPKQFSLLGGKPIMIHSLEIFEKMPEINKIILVALPELIHEFETFIKIYDINKAICIKGGATRQLSVYNGLNYITSNRILIHEAARPFITVDFIRDLLSSLEESAVPVLDISSTVVNIDSTKKYPIRNSMKLVQLPQIYNTSELKAAHDLALKADKLNYTDDSSLMYDYFQSQDILSQNKINYIAGIEENIKITTPLDMKIAEVIYNEISNNYWSK